MSSVLTTALNLIKPGMTVSLGGGSHVQALAELIQATPNLPVQLCTPSELTRDYCQSIGLPIVANWTTIDLAFDGCDSADQNLNLLKSNGGIHTLEKIYAQASDEYIIMTQSDKVTKTLNSKFPLTLEVIDEAVPQVITAAQQLNLTVQRRLATNFMGYTRSAHGNQLLDCFSQDWHEIHNLDQQLRQLNGVVGTSYFENLATKLLIETPEKTIKILKRGA
ncbi:ribose-5-phosphate isomerase A [Agrilactobacillus yilanensis]|uniref:ribose-5-phosphate isomerase n=1 Tax=Agrilactobacillus yilanensis TaxID=2485997 RepID=A0ABW4J4S2_9LACO